MAGNLPAEHGGPSMVKHAYPHLNGLGAGSAMTGTLAIASLPPMTC
jgi:hypothetical protein